MASPLSSSLWKQILRQNFTQWEKLVSYLRLNHEQSAEILRESQFPLNLPLRLAEKIQKGTLDDPILKQFLPTKKEEENPPEFTDDPVGDSEARLTPKLLQKFEGRALLVTTSACAMHCRYCFRQNFDYVKGDKGFQEELDIISKETSLNEVILSGGDPLSLSEQTLQPLLSRIAEFKHIKRIRFHTRFPIGIPERIDEHFLEMLSQIPQQIWFIIHSNHPLELDDEVLKRLKKIKALGATLLNQAVLLRGVNDDLNVMRTLCEKLIDNGILPYYLHQLDRVKGSSHFEVSEKEGQQLIREISTLLPAYGVPKYVRELPGQPYKIPL